MWSTVQKNWTEFKMKVRADRPETSDGRVAERQALSAGKRNAAGKKVRLVYWPTTRVVAVEAED
jgi:hypothetical protein